MSPAAGLQEGVSPCQLQFTEIKAPSETFYDAWPYGAASAPKHGSLGRRLASFQDRYSSGCYRGDLRAGFLDEGSTHKFHTLSVFRVSSGVCGNSCCVFLVPSVSNTCLSRNERCFRLLG